MSEGSFPGSEWVPLGLCVSVRWQGGLGCTGHPPPGGWAPHSASHPQPDVLRDVWRLPSAHRAALGPLLPPTLPCLASVSMWTLRVRGGRHRPTANVGLRGGPSSGPSAALETGSSPHPPSLEGALLVEVRPETSRASPAPWSPSHPFSWATGLSATSSVSRRAGSSGRPSATGTWAGRPGRGGAGRKGVSAQGLELQGPWRAGPASPRRSWRGLPPAARVPGGLRGLVWRTLEALETVRVATVTAFPRKPQPASCRASGLWGRGGAVPDAGRGPQAGGGVGTPASPWRPGPALIPSSGQGCPCRV